MSVRRKLLGEEEGEEKDELAHAPLAYINGPYANCRLPPDGTAQTIGRWFAYGRRNSERHIRRGASARE